MTSRLVPQLSRAIVIGMLLSMGCLGFHDTSSISSIYHQRDVSAEDGSIEGHVRWSIGGTLVDDLGQEIVLFKSGVQLASTVSDIEAQFKLSALAPGNDYVLKFPVRCFETSWHKGYSRRVVELPVAIRAGATTEIFVSLDCPQEPIVLE